MKLPIIINKSNFYKIVTYLKYNFIVFEKFHTIFQRLRWLFFKILVFFQLLIFPKNMYKTKLWTGLRINSEFWATWKNIIRDLQRSSMKPL